MGIVAHPLIGLTLDSEQASGYSQYPWYALRANYAAALAEHGALAVGLTHDLNHVDQILDRIEGLVVTGGAFDVDPIYYGEAEVHATVTLKAGRTACELALIRGALARDMPILGICGGQQLLAVALGGTLIQHIPDAIETAVEHEQSNPRHEAGHDLTIIPNTILSRIVGTEHMSVNSAHHQAVRHPGLFARVNATAPDGVIEGIEDPRHKFCVGVQWHPEFLISPGDRAIFRAFVEAAS